jgi:hypothetical protein
MATLAENGYGEDKFGDNTVLPGDISYLKRYSDNTELKRSFFVISGRFRGNIFSGAEYYLFESCLRIITKTCRCRKQGIFTTGKRHMHKRLTFIMLLFLTTIPIFSAENVVFERPPKITVSAISVADDPDLSVGGVVQAAAVLQLRMDGSTVQILEAGGYPPRKDGQDYVLLLEFQTDGVDVSVEVYCMNSGKAKEKAIATASWSGALSLSLDEEIQSLISTYISPVIADSFDASMNETERAAETGEAWAVAAMASIEKTQDPELDTVAAPESAWALETGAYVFIPLSDTATYTKVGYGGRISFGYALPTKTVFFLPRLVTGGLWLPTESTNKTDIVMVPLGAELKMFPTSNMPLLPYLRLGGGITWFMVLQENSAVQGKIVPYAELGAGIDIATGGIIGIEIDVAFSVYFEGSVVLFGIAPGIAVAFSF